jgi:DNA (cytosine-5)-methyltransferase 1
VDHSNHIFYDKKVWNDFCLAVGFPIRNGGSSLRNAREGQRRAQVFGVVKPDPTNGYWRDAYWLGCRDGKWLPVEPGTFPLDDGTPARVGRLRGYGNAINAQAEKIFIESFT